MFYRLPGTLWGGLEVGGGGWFIIAWVWFKWKLKWCGSIFKGLEPSLKIVNTPLFVNLSRYLLYKLFEVPGMVQVWSKCFLPDVLLMLQEVFGHSKVIWWRVHSVQIPWIVGKWMIKKNCLWKMNLNTWIQSKKFFNES